MRLIFKNWLFFFAEWKIGKYIKWNSRVQAFKNALATGCTILSEWTGSAAAATNAAAAAATANGINLKTDDLLALEEC